MSEVSQCETHRQLALGFAFRRAPAEAHNRFSPLYSCSEASMNFHTSSAGSVDPGELLCPVPIMQASQRKPLARRVGSLQGLTVALLGNLKPNCDVLLHTAGEELVKAGAQSILFREKSSCSLGAAEAILDEIASNCQVAVVALGD
jgi:hypothetical protein